MASFAPTILRDDAPAAPYPARPPIIDAPSVSRSFRGRLAHEPLRLLRDIVEFAAIGGEADRGELQTLAAEWGVGRLWWSTDEAARAVLCGEAQPRSLRLWAQNLGLARERTVLETTCSAG